MTEHDLQNQIRLELSKRGVINFRTNVGKIRMADGRMFDTGLPKGFSDLMGVLPDGRAVFIEVKVHPNKPSREQLNFIAVMQKQGALAGVAYSVEDALKISRIDKED